MLCPNCETENREGAKFCDECGFPLTGAIAARAAEAAAASEVSADEDALQAAESDVDATAVLEPVEETDESTAEDEPVEQAPDQVEDTAEEEADAEAGEVPDGVDEADVTMALDDLAGLEQFGDDYGERVVGVDYLQPQPNWRDGNTMQMPRIEGEEAPRSKDFLASSTTKQKKGKKVAIGIIVAIVAIAAIVAFGTYQAELWGGHAIPDVRGMTEADATSILEEAGFEVRSTQVKSDDTEGLVLVMDPTAGSRADEGAEVVIHIATAREIPDIVGKSEEDAKALIDEAGYENVAYEKERSDAEEGTVISVSPEAGTRAKSSVEVVVKVAEAYVVPDTSTLNLDGSIEAIQGAGLAYDVYYVDTQDYVEGTVIGTEPAANTKVKSDTVVVINVARARGAQLMELTRSTVAPGTEVSLGGTSYIVSSIDNVEYLGNDQVSFTGVGRPYTYFFGVYVEGDPQSISGTVTFTSDNQVSSIS